MPPTTRPCGRSTAISPCSPWTRGENSADPGDVVACPGRDSRVKEGDWTAMIGTADKLIAQGIEVAPIAQTEAGHRGARG